MENVNTAKIITLENRPNTSKEILIMYSIGRFYAQPLHRNISKKLEAIFIALYKPSLNDQKSFDRQSYLEMVQLDFCLR